MRPRSLLGRVAVVAVSVLVVSAVGLGAALASGTLAQPSVEGVENEWGDTTAESTEIRTNVAVNNPNPFGTPGVVDMGYTVAMNDVTVAEGTKRDVGLPAGRTTVSLSTRMDHDRIPAWWASHVNNGERTTVRVTPSVRTPVGSVALPTRDRSFETNIRSAFEGDEGSELRFENRTVLRVTETRAEWGDATEERTPLRFSAVVENPGEGEVVFSQLGYTIAMNDVTVAEGTTDGEVRVAADGTDTIVVDAALDNGKLPEWWVSHVENGERTEMNVSFYALMDDDGETERVPLSFLSKRVAFTTDVLGGGETTTKSPPVEESLSFAPPSVSSVGSEWVVPEEGDTRVRTRAAVTNPNEPGSAFADHLSVDARYAVRMNDVPLVEGTAESDLEPGTTELDLSDAITDREVQRWWVSHVNNGERSERVVDRNVTVDAGFVRLPIHEPAERGTVTTDMFAPVDPNATQTLSVGGERVGTVTDTRAEWGEATFDRTPVGSSATITNERDHAVRITEIGHRVSMNDVVLADGSKAASVEVGPNDEATVTDTMVLDNSRLGDWWRSHVERGERTTVSVSYYVVVEYRGVTERVELDAMNYERTEETDVLGDGTD